MDGDMVVITDMVMGMDMVMKVTDMAEVHIMAQGLLMPQMEDMLNLQFQETDTTALKALNVLMEIIIRTKP